jgi:hypothetical protein
VSALRVLREVGAPGLPAVESILPLLRDPEEPVRITAVLALSRLGQVSMMMMMIRRRRKMVVMMMMMMMVMMMMMMKSSSTCLVASSPRAPT